MSLEMHGVGGWDDVLDNDADGVVVTEVVDTPLRIIGVRSVALVCEDE